MRKAGLDAYAHQVAEPRAFKSHLDWERIPKGARYINAVRDPADVAMSLFRFFDGWRIEPGAIDPDTFVLEFFLERDAHSRYWPHVLSWWRQRRWQSSLAFMQRHVRQFDDHLVREARDADCGLPPDGVASKVATGVAGGGRRSFAASTLDALAAAWREQITPATGLADYTAMREALRAERAGAG